MRQILVVNNDLKGGRYAIPFDTKTEAKAAVLDVLKETDGLYAEDGLTGFLKDLGGDYLIEDERQGGIWVRIFIEPEGPEGVYLGFDSGNRDNYTAPFPADEDSRYGDADAYVFRTVGIKSGTRMEVSEVK